MSNSALTRLFVTFGKNVPATELLSFTSPDAVARFFGVGSTESNMAQTYFSGPYAGQATMLVTRVNQEQRPHVRSGFLPSLSSLNSIIGSASLTFRDLSYSGTVNLVGATTYGQVANRLETALNSTLTMVARTSGDTITAHTASFTGYVENQVIHDLSGDPLVNGGIMSQFPPHTGYANQLVLVNGGIGKTLSVTYPGQTPVMQLNETYGVLHVGNVLSGQVKAGFMVIGPGVASMIIQDLGGGNWLVNDAQNVSGDYTIFAPPMTVSVGGISGPSYYLDVQPNGGSGYNQLPSNLGFLSGSAAEALNLTSTTAAFCSTPGGVHQTTNAFLDSTMREAQAISEPYTSLQQVNGVRSPSIYENWALMHGKTWLPEDTTTRPAGDNGPGITLASREG